MENDQLRALHRRVLLPWQVQRGSAVWAPWGKSGWSAVVIKVPQRKWAKGMRVKPHNGEETAKGKVPLDRLLKRDPKLKGKDRPELSPQEIFAALKPEPEPEPETVPEPEVTVPEPISDPEPKPSTPKKSTGSWTLKKAKNSWDRAFGKGSWDSQPTDDDW